MNPLSPNPEQRYLPRPIFSSNPPSLSFLAFSQTSLGFKSRSLMKSVKFMVRPPSCIILFIIIRRVLLDRAVKISEILWMCSSNASSSPVSSSISSLGGLRGISNTISPSLTNCNFRFNWKSLLDYLNVITK